MNLLNCLNHYLIDRKTFYLIIWMKSMMILLISMNWMTFDRTLSYLLSQIKLIHLPRSKIKRFSARREIFTLVLLELLKNRILTINFNQLNLEKLVKMFYLISYFFCSKSFLKKVYGSRSIKSSARKNIINLKTRLDFTSL